MVFHIKIFDNYLVGVTDMNERSSRSHTIFRIIMESLEGGADESEDDGRAIKVIE